MTADNFSDKSVIAIEREIAMPLQTIILDGTSLSAREIISVAKGNSAVEITGNPLVTNRLNHSYHAMMQDIMSGTPVYGCNVSFGGRAAWVLNSGDPQTRVQIARELSAALTFLDVGIGPVLPKEIVRSAMVIRINMLLQGVSGIRCSTLRTVLELLNKDITPVVNAYGGVSASGDLIHNQRLVSAARGLPSARVMTANGEIRLAQEVMQESGLELLQLDPKEGLALVNGDNFSTAMALYVTYRLIQYLLLATVAGALTIEVLKGTNRSFHPLLAHVRPHPGQKEARLCTASC